MDEVFTKDKCPRSREHKEIMNKWYWLWCGKLWGSYGKQIRKSDNKVGTLLCMIIRLLTYYSPFNTIYLC